MDELAGQPEWRAELRESWNAISAGWMRWQETFERGGAPVTDRLLHLAGVRPGQRVLDVGTGLGDPAIPAADLVGPHGCVVGIDLSDEMLHLARQRASGRRNVEFVQADPETLIAERFDVVLSRWCLMLVPNRLAILRALRRLLVPGGVLAAAVWGPAETAPMISLAFPVLAERLQLPPPPPGLPSPYAMADPQQCRRELADAGFTEITVVEQDAPFWFHRAEEYACFSHDVLPLRFRRMLHDRFGSPRDPQTWTEVARRAEGYTTPEGRVSLTSIALCLRAQAPLDPPREDLVDHHAV